MKKNKYANIEAERVRNGLSKKEFTKELGISPKTYENWQQPKGDIPASKLLVMSKMFSCSIDYLLE
jgi:DNA-binding transcriptional regulator YiaG